MLRRSDDGKVRVLSLSYGKDSIATIRTCELLGYPLDRIVTADVWATQDIPADLPPMWEFKKKADEIIFDRWGIRVEHLCAMQRESAKRLSYNDYFYGERQKGKRSGQTIGFPMQRNPWCNKLKTEKIDILGYILSTAYPKEQDGYAGGHCKTEEYTDSRSCEGIGATAPSKKRPCRDGMVQGTQTIRPFPIRPNHAGQIKIA